MEIDVNTIATAHEFVVKEIMESGEEQNIETHPGKWEKTWEYHDPITIILRTPGMMPMVSDACMFGEKSMEKYSADFLCLTPPRADGKGAVYTYANRLFDYPSWVHGEDEWFGNGDGRGTNQIQQIVARLIKNKESRRAIGITWVPQIDSKSDEPPCMQFAHFMIRNCRYVWEKLDPNSPRVPETPREFVRTHDLKRINAEDEGKDGYLHARFTYRSKDALSAYGANACGETALMRHVALEIQDKTGWVIGLGSLTTFSSNAHIYWVRDDHELGKFKEVLRIA